MNGEVAKHNLRFTLHKKNQVVLFVRFCSNSINDVSHKFVLLAPSASLT